MKSFGQNLLRWLLCLLSLGLLAMPLAAASCGAKGGDPLQESCDGSVDDDVGRARMLLQEGETTDSTFQIYSGSSVWPFSLFTRSQGYAETQSVGTQPLEAGSLLVDLIG